MGFLTLIDRPHQDVSITSFLIFLFPYNFLGFYQIFSN